ncbi:1,4-alpha-glucan (glycogen) branching enzyme, GH-13-type [Thermodesulfovibrio sp. N1]|uniref:1,4-alpha-glucan branching protein GlgB n=1 Tax=unclassified Thermodesulfovibrio TaxID=2645936 RepID=UPI000839ECD7|nr:MULTISPECIES: 1,4-alpha-glucan branching protein GlgB [unclassified Thermodesulfovibrio]MDI1472866.1 1,4-alpha-glucan branching protein GlgB [Thermodesulfovibrio sp. 1176]ODA44523.1 1,4-alpha-glucan (glycogen) branching enzyme, GH-13-type [Thermodesulfovibrio sp. N1]
MFNFITDFDIYLFGEGNHLKIYEKLGAHLIKFNDTEGVHFAVWAPNAKYVSVIGDFNEWNPSKNPMKLLGSSGIWTTFIEGLKEGSLYKYYIHGWDNSIQLKADPYGFFFEIRPKSASIVYKLKDKYIWNDSKWIEKRKNTNWLKEPISIYEVHLGSWKRKPDGSFLNYRELAHELIPYVKWLGFTHIELLPIAEHPLDESWGYQCVGYYAPTSRFGTPQDFMYFVDYAHQNDIGVIVDWVPSHFPKDGHGLIRFDGTALYEHEDPRKGEHKDWGTLIYNYGRNEVRNFLIANALFWFDVYHIDGLRVDAVASMLYLDYSKKEGEWIPNIYGGKENLEAIDFLRKMNELNHGHYPGTLTIAEESTAWPMVTRPTYIGGLGFTMKWNMGWMHDTLFYFSKDPIFRKYHTNSITFSLLYAFSENFVLPLSHDEVVYGKGSLFQKMPGDKWQKLANLKLLYGYMYGHPGKKLLFMGSEFAQINEWNWNWQIEWHLLDDEAHRGVTNFIRDLNSLYKKEKALYEVDFHWNGFEWIDFSDSEQSIISFIRKSQDKKDFLIFVFNLTPVPRFNYRIGVPEEGFYKELLNSDSYIYGGSNLGNNGGVWSQNYSFHGRPYSIELTLPPLAVLVLKKS